jgi:hypothetical protein
MKLSIVTHRALHNSFLRRNNSKYHCTSWNLVELRRRVLTCMEGRYRHYCLTSCRCAPSLVQVRSKRCKAFIHSQSEPSMNDLRHNETEHSLPSIVSPSAEYLCTALHIETAAVHDVSSAIQKTSNFNKSRTVFMAIVISTSRRVRDCICSSCLQLL